MNRKRTPMKIEHTILDTTRDAEQRKTAFEHLSQRSPKQAFNLTLTMYKTLDTKTTFKGYKKTIHKKQNTEFLFFRDMMRSTVYNYFRKHPRKCTSQLQRLRKEKNLNKEIKQELSYLCSDLSDPEEILCLDFSEKLKHSFDSLCRTRGITYDDILSQMISENKEEIRDIIREISQKHTHTTRTARDEKSIC
ncbi:MAG: hypothetical protein JW840_02990 [Candidatus Thermoplasmatota archaeon]|nr:hypothetical protein [Candidatus Thermoplasmatota archaeon]